MNSQSVKLSSPIHSEWGVLNSLKQHQYQQALRMQKILNHQKKQAFRQALQNQLKMKQNSHLYQKQQDRSYYNFILNKTKNQQNKQKQQKQQKFYTRRSMDWQNRLKQMQQRQSTKNSRFKHNQNEAQDKYIIGYRDQQVLKQQQLKRKQSVIVGLAEQMRQKQIKKKIQRMQQIQQFQKDMEYQNNLSKSQQKYKNKFQQNDKVFQYYSSIYQQKQQQKDQLEYNLIQKPMINKMQSEQQFNKRKTYQQLMKKHQIKDALDQQVDQHRTQQKIQKQYHPEQVSYKCFGNMFDMESKGYGRYDKNQYKKYLQRQMMEQRQNKKKFQYMDQREYLYNINQINKALTGTYLNDTYQDCSIANVGEKLKIDSKQVEHLLDKSRNSIPTQNPQSPTSIQNEDQKLIKSNLEQLLKKRIVHKPVNKN